MNDVILQWRQFSELLSDISQFVTVGSIGEVC